MFLVCLAVALPAAAKRIYTYRDENGVLHFTDRKPDTDAEVEERLVEVENKKMVDVREEGPPGNRRYYFFNHWRGPAEVRVEFSLAENVVAEPSLPRNFVMTGYGEEQLFTVKQAVDTLGARYALRFFTVPGDPEAVPDENHAYRLPFRQTKKYFVGQGFGGSASHNDDQSYHAVDISMPKGTPVMAAREGVVMHVEEDFYGAGTDLDRYGTRANNVRILHEDGTMAVYAHLQLEGVAVKPGSAVLAGELIGFSGNTGYSTGPHLHFVIQRNVGGKLKSIPFRFDDGTATGSAPREGRWLEYRR